MKAHPDFRSVFSYSLPCRSSSRHALVPLMKIQVGRASVTCWDRSSARMWKSHFFRPKGIGLQWRRLRKWGQRMRGGGRGLWSGSKRRRVTNQRWLRRRVTNPRWQQPKIQPKLRPKLSRFQASPRNLRLTCVVSFSHRPQGDHPVWENQCLVCSRTFLWIIWIAFDVVKNKNIYLLFGLSMNQDSWISGLKSWHPALILTVLLCLPVVLMLAHPRFSRRKLSTNINMKDSVIQTTVWDDSIPVKGPQRNRLFSQSLLQALLRGGSKIVDLDEMEWGPKTL